MKLSMKNEVGASKLILMLSWFNLVNRYESACRVPNDSDQKLARSSGPI